MTARETLRGIGSIPRKAAYALAAVNVCLVPVHYFVSCEVSGAMGMAGIVLAALVVAGCLVMRRSIGGFGPALIAVGGGVLGLLSVH